MGYNNEVATKLLEKIQHHPNVPFLVKGSIAKLGEREDQAATDALIDAMTNLELSTKMNKEELREWAEWLQTLEPFAKFAATLLALF